METFNYNNNINFNNTIDTDITVVLNDTIYSETNNNTDDLTAHTHDNSNQVHTNEVSSLPSEPWFNEESVIYSHPELNNTIVDLSSEPSNEINQSNLDQRFNTGFGILIDQDIATLVTMNWMVIVMSVIGTVWIWKTGLAIILTNFLMLL